jgi:hypothetical protein
MIQEVTQFEVTRIATQSVDGGNIMLGIFLDAEKVQSRIGIMPDGGRLKIGVVQPFDLESYGIPISADPHGTLRLVPGGFDIRGNLCRQRTVRSASIEI